MSVAHRKADDKQDILAENLENAATFVPNGNFDKLSEIPREVVVQLLTDEQRANELETGSLEIPAPSRVDELRNEALSLRTIGRARPFAYTMDKLICVAAEIYARRGGHVAQFNPSYPPGAYRPATKTAVARTSDLSAYASAFGRFLVSVLTQLKLDMTRRRHSHCRSSTWPVGDPSA
jgi:hypothetical protein